MKINKLINKLKLNKNKFLYYKVNNNLKIKIKY